MKKKRILALLLSALLLGTCPVYGEEAETVEPVNAEEEEGAEAPETSDPMPKGVKELCQICDQAEGKEILELGDMPGLRADTRASIEQVISRIEDKQYQVSFLLLDLKTGQGYSRNPEHVYFGGDSIQGPYAAALAEKIVDEGTAALTDQLERDSVTEEEGSGTIKEDPAGTSYTLQEVLNRTVSGSDHMGYAMLRKAYGSEFFGKWLKGGNVETSYAGKQWPSYDVRTLSKMWISIYEYFQSGRGISAQLMSSFEGAEGSVITEAVKERYTAYAKPGRSADAENPAWHDAALVMAGDAPYLMVLMTDIPWQEENKEYKAVLTELAGYLDQAHEEVFPQPTPEPEQTEPVSVSQVPEQEEKKPIRIPAAVWICAAILLAGGGFFAFRVRSVRRERELQKQQWEASKKRRRS